MSTSSFRLAPIVVLICLELFSESSAQRRPGSPSTVPPNPTIGEQVILISGKVVMKGGAPPPVSVAIEKVCSGSVRRVANTDSKGEFQFAWGQWNSDSQNMQDASESGRQALDSQPLQLGTVQIRFNDLMGCELQAAYPGYQSTRVPLDIQRADQRVGTLELIAMGEGGNSTVSLTTLEAPAEARNAYEKGLKALAQGNLGEAERLLEKAASTFPQFAAAWSDLGMLHLQQNLVERAAEEFTKGINADPHLVKPYLGMINVALRKEQWQEALRFADAMAKQNAMVSPICFLYVAMAHYNLGHLEAAEASVIRFLSLDTAHVRPDAFLLLSTILAKKRDYAGAAEQDRNYLKSAPNAADAEQVKAELKKLEGLSAANVTKSD